MVLSALAQGQMENSSLQFGGRTFDWGKNLKKQNATHASTHKTMATKKNQ